MWGIKDGDGEKGSSNGTWLFADEEIKIEKTELRGLSSNGMLASAKELDFGEEHEGVLPLDTDVDKGTTLVEAYELDDLIVELDNKSFTNRPDCFGIIGFAREVSGIQELEFKNPEWIIKARKSEIQSPKKLSVKNKAEKLVPSYLLQSVDGVKVQNSPQIVQSYLSRLGVRPINSIVDSTNYMMLMTGQPLHAFDGDKIKGTVTVRLAEKDEKLKLLDGKQITFVGEEILICDGDNPIAIGGVMGGAETEVTAKTKNIILEAANFDMYSIRRTSMRHGIFTDAVTRFSRGQSPELTEKVLPRCIEMITKTSGGKVSSKVAGVTQKQKPTTLAVDIVKVGNLLGRDLEIDKVASVLSNVSISSNITGQTLDVSAPYWRSDISIYQDIAEEIGRLGGYDKIKPTLPKKAASAFAIPRQQQIKASLREALVASGGNELMTYSGISSKLAQKVGWDTKSLFKITNSRSPELEFMRPSLIGSLLDKVHQNHKQGHKTIALFEINPVHFKSAMQEKLPRELSRLGFVYSAKERTEGAPYYLAKKYLDNLLSEIGINVEYKETINDKIDGYLDVPYANGRTAYINVGGKTLGIIGEFKTSVTKNFKLPEGACGFELLLDNFMDINLQSVSYKPLNKFPAVTRDLTYEINDRVKFFELEASIRKFLDSNKEITYDLRASDIFRGKEGRRITFALDIWHENRTLTSQEVNDSIKAMASKLKSTIGATQI